MVVTQGAKDILQSYALNLKNLKCSSSLLMTSIEFIEREVGIMYDNNSADGWDLEQLINSIYIPFEELSKEKECFLSLADKFGETHAELVELLARKDSGKNKSNTLMLEKEQLLASENVENVDDSNSYKAVLHSVDEPLPPCLLPLTDCKRKKVCAVKQSKDAYREEDTQMIKVSGSSEMEGDSSSQTKQLSLDRDEAKPQNFEQNVKQEDRADEALPATKSVKFKKVKIKKPIICDLCGQTFKKNYNLNRHKGRKHKDSDNVKTKIVLPIFSEEVGSNQPTVSLDMSSALRNEENSTLPIALDGEKQSMLSSQTSYENSVDAIVEKVKAQHMKESSELENQFNSGGTVSLNKEKNVVDGNMASNKKDKKVILVLVSKKRLTEQKCLVSDNYTEEQEMNDNVERKENNSENTESSGQPENENLFASVQKQGDKNVKSKASLKRYTCPSCGRKFQRFFYLKQHEEFGHKGLSCLKCGKSFPRHYSLKRHVYNVHEFQDHSCAYCSKRFKNKSDVRQHYQESCKVLHDNNTSPVLCELCGMSCSNRIQYLQHVKQHQESTDLNLTCDMCMEETQKSEIFSSHIQLWRHKFKAHEKRKLKYFCKVCNKAFNSTKTLEKHEKTHEDITCVTCGKWFAQKKHLDQHVEIHKPGRKRDFFCERCGKDFYNKRDCERHVKAHSESYGCNMCGKVLTTRASLQCHILSHKDERSFKCSVCGKGFNNRYGLKKHEVSHTGVKKYKCQECGKAFSRYNTWARHRRIHTGEKPYSCQYCDMRFIQGSARDRHVRTHTGEKPYGCVYCDMKFAQISTRNSHERRHHHQNMEPLNVNALDIHNFVTI